MKPDLFKPLAIAPAYQQIFDAIEHQIVSGGLAPGDLLPSELDLARQFGVNRSTVREGIRLLEHSGFVAREGGKRLTITLPHYMDLASRASRALAMQQVTFRELWETSMALEPVAAAAAAVHIDDDGLAALAGNIARMEQAIEDIDEVVRLDMEFHEIVAQNAGNRALALAREPIGLLFLPAGRIILPRLKTQGRILAAHKAIYALLAARDTEGARNWMTRHMADFKRGYERTGVDMNTPLDMASFAPV